MSWQPTRIHSVSCTSLLTICLQCTKRLISFINCLLSKSHIQGVCMVYNYVCKRLNLHLAYYAWIRVWVLRTVNETRASLTAINKGHLARFSQNSMANCIRSRHQLYTNTILEMTRIQSI